MTSGGNLRSLSNGPPGATRNNKNVSVATTHRTMMPWRKRLRNRESIALRLNVTQRGLDVMCVDSNEAGFAIKPCGNDGARTASAHCLARFSNANEKPFLLT